MSSSKCSFEKRCIDAVLVRPKQLTITKILCVILFLAFQNKLTREQNDSHILRMVGASKGIALSTPFKAILTYFSPKNLVPPLRIYLFESL